MRTQTYSFMTFVNRLNRLPSLLAVCILAMAWAISPAHAQTAASSAPQESFPSSDAAIASLQTAVAANDQSALGKLFGPEFHELMTGDKVQDANNFKKLAADLAERCHPVKDDDNKITLEIGSNNWPMPIPLVQSNGQWHFDTAAGKEEIINRHIGKDELCAIGVCRAYVTAQLQYARLAGEGSNYALKFKSTPGQKDGLYWPVSENEAASPFGPLVAEAHAEGYITHKSAGPHPFHGYYFKILTRQGEAASGGDMDYMSGGKLTGGFALVAYPEHWDQSGIMTFIVNQDGKVYQRNFAEKTAWIAGAMKDYNPDNDWTPVPDEGVLSAVSEK